MKNSWLFSAWRRLFVTAALLMALLIGVSAKADALGAATLIALTNTQRSAAGLAPLNYDGRLASSAYAKAQDMLAKGYWSHTSPDGRSAGHFIGQAGYGYVAIGENLAKGFPTESAVITGWMASSGHRANILNPAFKDIGIGIVSGVFDGEQTIIVVAHYGATAAAPAPKPAPVQTAPIAVSRPATVRTSTVQPSVLPTQAEAPAAPIETQPAVETQKPKDPLAVLIENLTKIIEPKKDELIRL
jgi:hypothetical protein